MKKLLTLLCSLLVVGTTISASEEFGPKYNSADILAFKSENAITPISVGFYLENENVSDARKNEAYGGDGNIGAIYLGTDVKFKTENWNYHMVAHKIWMLDDTDILATGSRFQIKALRSFNKDENFKYALGTGWRMDADRDRYYLDGNYSYGLTDDITLSGSASIGYTSISPRDYLYSEIYPLKVTYSKVSLGWYVENKIFFGEGNDEYNFTLNELEIAFPLSFLSTDSLKVNFLYRMGFYGDHNSKTDEPEKRYEIGNHHMFMLSAELPVTENSKVSAHYMYEITRDYDYVDGDTDYDDGDTGKYHGDFKIMWTYIF